MIVFHLLSIANEWSEEIVAEKLMNAAGLDTICSADFYKPVSCLYDDSATTASLTMEMRKTMTTPFILTFPDVARLLSPLSFLLLLATVAIPLDHYLQTLQAIRGLDPSS